MSDLKKINKIGYVHQPLCKICSARDMEGNPLRDEIDGMLIQGATAREVSDYCKRKGVSIAEHNVYRHKKLHSPYIKGALKAGTKAGRVLKMRAEKIIADSDKVIDKVITIGETMIDNWVEGKEGEKQLPVSEKMFLEAVKEQGRRGQKTILDVEMFNMEKELIDSNKIAQGALEGEVVEDESEHSSSGIQE